MTGRPAAEGAPDRRRWGRLWLPALAGIALFLAGAFLGALLAVSVILYRNPAGPALPSPASSPLPSHTHLPTPASPSIPTPTTRPIGPGVGQQAPPFSLPTLDDAEVALESYRGRPVLLHFWASWCPPCREEWPAWQTFASSPAAAGIVILAVNVEESPEVVRQFLGEDRPPFPVLLDSDGQVNARYHIRALPMTFLIDAEGIVRRVVPGGMSVEALERLVGR